MALDESSPFFLIAHREAVQVAMFLFQERLNCLPGNWNVLFKPFPQAATLLAH